MIEVFYKTTCCFGALTLFMAWLNGKYEGFINENILFGVVFVFAVLIGAGFGITLIDAGHFIYSLVKRIWFNG